MMATNSVLMLMPVSRTADLDTVGAFSLQHFPEQVKEGQRLFEGRFQLDYLVNNNGSRDGTKNVCRENGIHCLSLIQNLGIGGAVQTGYQFAQKTDNDMQKLSLMQHELENEEPFSAGEE